MKGVIVYAWVKHKYIDLVVWLAQIHSTELTAKNISGSWTILKYHCTYYNQAYDFNRSLNKLKGVYSNIFT